MTTQNFDKVNDIFNCKLLLEDGTEFTIPLREDGYIYATGLCKVAGKKMYDWLRLKETKKLQKTIEENKNKSGIPYSQIVEVYRGNNFYTSGTWIHPDLGLNLAQWCSPNFSAQVSKWLRELIFTGKVELGKEKGNEEINEKYQELINELNETKKKLETTENLVKAYDESNRTITKKYRQVQLNHQAYLRHKELYKLKTGPCVYIIDMKKTYDEEETMRYKIGQTGDITSRVSGFRTSNPFCKVISVVYTDKNIDLEKSMKIKYEQQLLPNNSEFVSGVSKEILKEDLFKIADILNLNYTMETDDELQKFNRHILLEKDVEEVDDDKVDHKDRKRCGGLTHKTEESRMQPFSNFFKHKAHKDGHSRLCKECYLVGVYGDKRKRRKVIAIPDHDSSVQKWCNLCENLKEHKEFYPDKMKKDGLNANCIACKANQKKKRIELRKARKQEGEEEEEPKKIDKEKLQQIQEKNPFERYTKNELREILKDKHNLTSVGYKKTKKEIIAMLTT